MKNKIIVLFVLLISTFDLNNIINAQDIWTQKTDYAGIETYGAVGLSIGSKGYIGTGTDSCNYSRKFWQYDPSTDTWTQKADFGGVGRFWAVGFTIGSKCYIGTGVYGDTSDIMAKDFWEYDTLTDNWTRKSDFGGCPRYGAVGFSIGSKGYIGTGLDSNYLGLNDFWEYDPANDTWTQKADFPGEARGAAAGFSIGTKGYIGTGLDNNVLGLNDFWEYNPANDTWAQKADFGGAGRDCASGFSINSKGYIAIGLNVDLYLPYNDLWEYNVANDNWTQKADYIGSAWDGAVAFSVGSKGYLGTGSGDTIEYKDFYEYSPSNVGIEELSSENISISPNPSSSFIDIESGLRNPAYSSYKIFDALGTMITKGRIAENKFQIDIRGFAEGLYFLKLENENGISIKKFIKQ